MFYYKKISIDLFPIQVRVFISKDIIAIRKMLAKKYDQENMPNFDNNVAALHSYFYTTEGLTPFLLFPIMGENCVFIGDIIHEAYHCVGRLLDNFDVHYDVDNDEVFAYMLEFLTTETFSLVEEKNLKLVNMR